MVWSTGKLLQNGRYTLQAVIGQGRFGITYLAETRDKNRLVIKTPNDEALNRADFERLQRVFVKEAFKLAKCKHPHIVQAYEPFQEEGVWCIPMEYIDGVTLVRLKQKVLPEAEALPYIQQIGEALREVHRNGFLHGDVRPANIMVRAGRAEAVLIDFGFAREFDHDLTVTRTKELATGFAPIELYSRQAERGPYTDVYSLAATLYILLTGEKPTSAADRGAYNAQLIAPKKHNLLISDAVNKAILRGLKLKGEDRPQSVEEWLVNLGVKAEQSPITVDPSSKPLVPGRQWDWHLFWAAVAAIGALLAVVPSFLGAMNNRHHSPQAFPSPSTPNAPELLRNHR
ncbi:MAG: serine/threonine protein kinase [Pseudanabaenales cyanobacterium]|nr:serine/threonine protein kinase [Pseudanabaenales cyanobacterium]